MPSHLNPSQQQAVEYGGGHLLIVAGPGTGKTHTLTHRIAAQISRLKDNQKILAVTFTHHAAGEMKERLEKLIELPLTPSPPAGRAGLKKEGESGLNSKITVGTFHAFCLDILRAHANSLKDFRIASEDDIETVVKICWPQLSAKERSQQLKLIGHLKSKNERPLNPPLCERGGEGEFCLEYNQALRAKNLLDYDDLLLEAVRLLETSQNLCQTLQETYPLIFVDEYQDINPVQHQLLLELAGEKSVVTAIGDPDQSIYGFRGSDASLFQRFVEDFPGARVLTLTDNYRSTESLLKASGQVILKNADAARQELAAQFHCEGHLTVYEAPTERAEAEYVVHRIERMVGGTSLFSQDSRRVEIDQKAQRCFRGIAVLYRLNSQRHCLQEAFDRSGIPYEVTGDKKLIDRKPVMEFLDAIEALPEGEPHISEKLGLLKSSTSWHKWFEKNPSWLKNVEQLIQVARDFTTIRDLRNHLALQQPEEPLEYQADKVRLMTLHASKGLEFPAVFITGCEDGLIPLWREGEDNGAEERRLFYVGMTRAKEELFLTCAKRRMMFGQTRFPEASPFLKDIQDDLKRIEAARQTTHRKSAKTSTQMSLFD